MTHTPGPWHITTSQSYIMAPYSAGGYSIARMDDFEAPVDQREANARLIAAAPDLLAALQLVWDTYGLDPSVDSSIWQTVRAAIAHATGEAP